MPPPSLAELRARVAALEGIRPAEHAAVAPLGVAEIDGVLPWGGLPLGCLHEIAPVVLPDGVEDGAAEGFAALALARLAERAGKPVLWVAASGPPYAPGLAAFGLTPAHLLVVRPAKAAQILWAMEEGLHCPALAGVLGETWGVDLTAGRRLQLAAQASGVPALLLNRGAAARTAVTRWRIQAVSSAAPLAGGLGSWRWRVELSRCRGRGFGEDGCVWLMEWSDEAHRLGVVAPSGDRPAEPQRSRRAG